MKFSVLLSLYYKESSLFLYDCLDSIEKNTCRPEQVVVVFDGPVGDELESVVNNFMNRLPIEIVPINKNIGLGNALNYGLQFCKNDIVFRMDTDDICLPDRFFKQYYFMQKNPDIVLLGGAIEEFDSHMEISQGVRFSASKHDDIKRYAIKRNPFNHMAVAFRKKTITSVGGYQHHYLMEDYNLWLRIISGGYLTHNLDDVLVNVRAGDNMILRRKGVRYINSEIKLAKLKYDLKLDGFAGIIWCAGLRIIPRLLPVSLLKNVYKILRK